MGGHEVTPATLTSALGMLVIERRKAVRKGRAHLLPAIDAASEAVAMVLRAMEEARREVPETVTGDFSPTLYAGRGGTELATLHMERA